MSWRSDLPDYAPIGKRTWCAKCAETQCLQYHHIVALCDGGANCGENLIHLCVSCHKEWHAFELACALGFDAWLCMPPSWILGLAYWTNDLDRDNIDAVMQSRFDAVAIPMRVQTIDDSPNLRMVYWLSPRIKAALTEEGIRNVADCLALGEERFLSLIKGARKSIPKRVIMSSWQRILKTHKEHVERFSALPTV